MSDHKRYWLAKKSKTSEFNSTLEFIHDSECKQVLINFRNYDPREELWEWIDSEWKFGGKLVRSGTWLTPQEAKLVWNQSMQEGYQRIDSVEVLRR